MGDFFQLVLFLLLSFVLVTCCDPGCPNTFFGKKSALVFLPGGPEVGQRLRLGEGGTRAELRRRSAESVSVPKNLAYFSANLESQFEADGFIL